MEVNALIEEKLALEQNISIYVTRLVSEFVTKTGVGVSSVSVGLNPVYEFGSRLPVITVAGAKIDLDI